MQQELLKKATANQDYEMLGKEITRLREEKYQLQLEDANREGVRQKVGVSLSYFNRIIRGREQIVNKTFIKILDITQAHLIRREIA